MKNQSLIAILFFIVLIALAIFIMPKQTQQQAPIVPDESWEQPKQDAHASTPEESEDKESENQVSSSLLNSKSDDETFNIQLTIGKEIFSAKLYDNATTRAFVERLPLTLTMNDMNRNEKYNYLDESLPTNSKKPGQIKSGDIMLFGSDCLVVFYKGLSSGYSYTSLGKLDDANGFTKAVGSSSVTITFERS